MKLSIVIAVYQSYEAVRRQLLYLDRMQLPDDIEIILVDDGSDPVIRGRCRNLRIFQTNDKRPWTQGIARNAGATIARGEYLLMTDIDHILSSEAITDSYDFTGDRMIFPRFLGVLLEDGAFTQDKTVLTGYGAKFDRGLYASYHGNTFCIKRTTFWKIGGYDEKHCIRRHHARERKGEDSYFNRKWNHYAVQNGIKVAVGRPVYIFPVGRFHIDHNLNPFGLFHNLKYDAVPQPNKI